MRLSQAFRAGGRAVSMKTTWGGTALGIVVGRPRPVEVTTDSPSFGGWNILVRWVRCRGASFRIPKAIELVRISELRLLPPREAGRVLADDAAGRLGAPQSANVEALHGDQG